MKALIVEENTEAIKELIHVLEHHGFEIKSCPGGIQAIQAMNAWLPTLLIINEKLPKFTGLEVIQLVSKTHSLDDTAIFFLSKSPSAELQQYVKKTERVKIMPIPVDASLFLAELDELIPQFQMPHWSPKYIRAILNGNALEKLPNNRAKVLAQKLNIEDSRSAWVTRSQGSPIILLTPDPADLRDLAELSDRALELQIRILEIEGGELIQLWPERREAA